MPEYVVLGYWEYGYAEGDAAFYADCGYFEPGYVEGDEYCPVLPTVSVGDGGYEGRLRRNDDEEVIMMCIAKFLEMVHA